MQHTAFLLAYEHLTSVHSKYQCQRQTYKECEYLAKVKDTTDAITVIKYEVAYGLSVSIIRFDLGHSKCQGQGHAYF